MPSVREGAPTLTATQWADAFSRMADNETERGLGLFDARVRAERRKWDEFGAAATRFAAEQQRRREQRKAEREQRNRGLGGAIGGAVGLGGSLALAPFTGGASLMWAPVAAGAGAGIGSLATGDYVQGTTQLTGAAAGVGSMFEWNEFYGGGGFRQGFGPVGGVDPVTGQLIREGAYTPWPKSPFYDWANRPDFPVYRGDK